MPNQPERSGEHPKGPLAWLAFFRAIKKAARMLDELEAQERNRGSRQ